MKEYHKTLCFDFISEDYYQDCISNPDKFKSHLNQLNQKYPELFPKDFSFGWKLNGFTRVSKKKGGLIMRRIKIKSDSEVYQVRPSFMMPYNIGKTEEIAKGLDMYQSGSSFESVARIQGKSAMFWYNAYCSLGRNSIISTTIKNSSKLPKHLAADEKHTKCCGQKVYIATTVANGCILGAAVSESAGDKGLLSAYSEFMDEAWQINPDYYPESVNTDGWKATKNAWKEFCELTVLVLCFLHSALKIQNLSKKISQQKELMNKVWDCYKAKSFTILSQRLRRLNEWALKENLPERIITKLEEFTEKKRNFKPGIEIDKAHRTSNMVDRLMNFQDKALYSAKNLHSLTSARMFVRSMALIWNFHPYCKKVKRHSPFEDLNGFVYHQNWLQNMMIATSCGFNQHFSNTIM